MRKLILIIIVGISTLFSFDTFQTKRAEGKILIDGKLSEQDWKNASEIPLEFEVSPRENFSASQKTIAKIVFDSENIYFGFVCYDTDIKKLRANISKRDQMFNDDFILVMLDTYNDAQKAFEFMVNPFGIQGDGVKTSNNEDIGFDIVWESAATINQNDSNWIVEMKIPFSNLRFPSVSEQKWRFVFGRMFPRESKTVFAANKFDYNNPCDLCQGNLLIGINNISSKSNFEFLPYVQTSQVNSLSDENKMSSEDLKGRVGTGFKYSSADFAIDAVVNPDFSQIESDETQISVNSTFGLYYRERRPFFIEGAEIFENRNQLFYSRTINDPLYALKLTGKNGKISYGVLSANDRKTPFVIPGEDDSFSNGSDKKSISNIARLRYDIGNNQDFGFLFTNRSIDGGAQNTNFGIDWRLRFKENFIYTGNYFLSNTKELNDSSIYKKLFEPSSLLEKYNSSDKTEVFDGENLNGHLFGMMIGYNSRDFESYLRVRETSPLFQSSNGFINKVNSRGIFFNQNFNFYPNNKYIDTWSIDIMEGTVYNFDKIQKELFVGIETDFELKGQIMINTNLILLNNETWMNEKFKMNPRFNFNAFVSPTQFYKYGLNFTVGDAIYYSDEPEIGNSFDFGFFVAFHPNSNFSFSINQMYSEMGRKNSDELFYSGYISRIYSTYSFNEKLFLRLITQYDGFEKAFNIFPLLTYQLNPFTVFYIGTTSDSYKTGEIYKENTRQYFLKFQYLVN